MRNNIKRIAALLLCAVLTAGIAAPGALAAENTVYIRSEQDWKRLVEDCRLDTWSQGKTVLLQCDLTLRESASIPTFAGTFDGGGHTIQGLKLTGEGANQGLFRYIQEGGRVENLTVLGSVAPQGDYSGLGGIVGSNRGTVAQCSFQGDVEGAGSVGGIAGVNEATGQIINCSVSGTISGEHYTGGIAGENYGSVILCTNKANVNTRQVEVSAQLDNVDWEHPNSTENMPACTDTGGIAGYSKGIVQNCTNYGAVGYPHTGYNVGGIAGRQAGYIDGCVNRGHIQGRKEVGGIVGQMEPYTLLKFEEDTLQSLMDELDVLSGLLNDTIDDAGASAHQVSDHITAAADLTDSARKDASGMLDAVRDLGEGSIDTVNDLSARISRVLEEAVPAAEELERFSGQLEDAVRRIEQALATLESGNGDVSGASDVLAGALDELSQAAQRLNRADKQLSGALDKVKQALGREAETQAALDELRAALEERKAALQQVGEAVKGLAQVLKQTGVLPDWSDEERAALRGALDKIGQAVDEVAGETGRIASAIVSLGKQLKTEAKDDRELIRQGAKETLTALNNILKSGSKLGDALEQIKELDPYLEGMGDTALEASGQVREALESLADGSDSMEAALGQVGDILQELAEEPALEFPNLDSAFHQKEEQLDLTLNELTQRLKTIGQTALDAGDSLASDLKRISAQFQVITGVLREMKQDDGAEEDRVVDISEENVASATLGKVSACTNQGAVDGDVNVGGLAGAMAIEFDFDPEDDITRQGSSSLSFQYQTQAILSGGVNYGAVTARKNCAGGAVGRMDLGFLTQCQNYGDVESTRGEYVGGIAGAGYAAIRDCWVKCTLRASHYVGGIAGVGTQVSGCRALVEIPDSTAYFGAIAGEVQDGVLSQNLFVSSALGGVDGVSYSGKAEPVDYGTLMQLEGVPEQFHSLTVTFLAGDRVVAKQMVDYGAGLGEDQLPQVPEREGYYAAWEALPEQIRFDLTVEAVYTPWLSVLSNGDGTILAEGEFPPDTSLLVSQGQYEPPQDSGTVCGQWRIETDNTRNFTALRLAVEEKNRNTSVWVRQPDGTWEELPCTEEGSFVRVELERQSAVVCVTQTPRRGSVVAVCLCCAGVVLAATAVLLRRRSGKRTSKNRKNNQTAGKN